MTEPPQSWGTPPPQQQRSWPQSAVEPAPYEVPPTSGRSTLPWVLGAAVLVLVLVVVGIVLLLRGGSDGADPESAATSFVAAVKDGDCEAFTALTTERFQDTYGRCSGDIDTAPFLDSDLVAVDDDVTITDETDDTATGEVGLSAAGFSVPLQLLLVREDERWLVDDLTLAGFGLDDVPGFEIPNRRADGVSGRGR